MPRTADRVKETTTTTGTGALTLAGAVTNFRTFATAFGSACYVEYAILGGSEWEVGRGLFNGSTGLSRDVVIASSNSNALVDFSAGTKHVIATFSGEMASLASNGNQFAMSQGMALP